MQEDQIRETEPIGTSDSAINKAIPSWEVEIRVNPTGWKVKNADVEPPASRVILIEKPMHIGRPSEDFGNPEIDLRIDGSVSRRHAELRFDSAGRLEIHLFTPKYRTLLRGEPLEHDEVRLIEDGDSLELGSYSILDFRIRQEP